MIESDLLIPWDHLKIEGLLFHPFFYGTKNGQGPGIFFFNVSLFMCWVHSLCMIARLLGDPETVDWLPMATHGYQALWVPLQGINISYLGKGKIIFKSAFLWDMLVPRRVRAFFAFFPITIPCSPTTKSHHPGSQKPMKRTVPWNCWS